MYNPQEKYHYVIEERDGRLHITEPMTQAQMIELSEADVIDMEISRIKKWSIRAFRPIQEYSRRTLSKPYIKRRIQRMIKSGIMQKNFLSKLSQNPWFDHTTDQLRPTPNLERQRH